jgi:hypothetical protein
MTGWRRASCGDRPFEMPLPGMLDAQLTPDVGVSLYEGKLLLFSYACGMRRAANASAASSYSVSPPATTCCTSTLPSETFRGCSRSSLPTLHRLCGQRTELPRNGICSDWRVALRHGSQGEYCTFGAALQDSIRRSGVVPVSGSVPSVGMGWMIVDNGMAIPMAGMAIPMAGMGPEWPQCGCLSTVRLAPHHVVHHKPFR